MPLLLAEISAFKFIELNGVEWNLCVYMHVYTFVYMHVYTKSSMLPGGFSIKSIDMFLLIRVNSVAVAVIINIASNTAANYLDRAYYSLFCNDNIL